MAFPVRTDGGEGLHTRHGQLDESKGGRARSSDRGATSGGDAGTRRPRDKPPYLCTCYRCGNCGSCRASAGATCRYNRPFDANSGQYCVGACLSLFDKIRVYRLPFTTGTFRVHDGIQCCGDSVPYSSTVVQGGKDSDPAIGTNCIQDDLRRSGSGLSHGSNVGESSTVHGQSFEKYALNPTYLLVVMIFKGVFAFTIYSFNAVPVFVTVNQFTVIDEFVVKRVPYYGFWSLAMLWYAAFVMLKYEPPFYWIWGVGMLFLFAMSRLKAFSFVLRAVFFTPIVLLLLNLHVLARSSRDADVELNPGPWWHDDPTANEMRASVGLVKQAQDVRIILLLCGVALTRLESEVQAFVSVNATATYFREHFLEQRLAPAGGSDASVAKAFRALYYGEVRADYINHIANGRVFSPNAYAAVYDVVNEVVGRTSGVFTPVGYVEGEVHDSEQVPEPSQSGPSHSEVPIVDKPKKVHCIVCGFDVNPDGHEERCKVPMDVSTICGAWIGDALHMFDVRVALMKHGVARKQLTQAASSYVSATAQAHYLLATGIYQELGRGPADTLRELSTAFENAYHGEFRKAYLMYLHAMIPRDFEGGRDHGVDVSLYTN